MEGIEELAGTYSEISRSVSYLAQGDNNQNPSGSQPFDDCLIESVVDEHVTKEEVDGRAGWKPVVEVEDIKSATISNSRAVGQFPSQLNGDRRNVDAPIVHASFCEPDRSSSSAAGEF